MTTTIQSVKGIVALVTGGASGLGRGVVERLLKQGAKGVIALDLKFGDQYPNSNVIAVSGSVTSEEDVNRALAECEKKFGRLDAVINCAGIGIAKRTYDFRRKISHPLDEFKRVIEVSLLLGALLLHN